MNFQPVKMSSSAIFVLDVKGKVLISRTYRGDMDMTVVDKFMPLLMEKEEEGMNHSPKCSALLPGAPFA